MQAFACAESTPAERKIPGDTKSGGTGVGRGRRARPLLGLSRGSPPSELGYFFLQEACGTPDSHNKNPRNREPRVKKKWGVFPLSRGWGRTPAFPDSDFANGAWPLHLRARVSGQGGGGASTRGDGRAHMLRHAFRICEIGITTRFHAWPSPLCISPAYPYGVVAK